TDSDTLNNGASYAILDTIRKNIYELKKDARYATKWLLTAVTGPDFIDDGDGYLDANDDGYWVKYTYELQDNEFENRIPAYGMSYTFQQRASDSVGFGKTNAPGNAVRIVTDTAKVSGRIGTFRTTTSQQYQLKKIT